MTNAGMAGLSEELKSYSKPDTRPLSCRFPLPSSPSPPHLPVLGTKNISLTPHGQHSCPSDCKHTGGQRQREDESLRSRAIYTLPSPHLLRTWDSELGKQCPLQLEVLVARKSLWGRGVEATHLANWSPTPGLPVCAAAFQPDENMRPFGQWLSGI